MAKWIRTLNKYEAYTCQRPQLTEVGHRTNRAPPLWDLQYSVDGSEQIGGLTQVDNSFGEWGEVG